MFESLDSFNIVLTVSCTYLFFLFATPFCWGVLVAEKCLLIPQVSQNSSNSSDVNYPPLSDLKHLIFISASFSTNALKALNFSNASYLCLRKVMQEHL